MAARSRKGTSTLDGEALLERAMAHLDAGEHFVAYLELLLAADAGLGEALVTIDVMHTAEHVVDEDQALAHLQVASWYREGQLVDADPRLAREHLKQARRRDEPALAADLERATQQVIDELGVSPSVDFRRPLGPAMPGTAGHVHPDQQAADPIGELPRRAPDKRPARKVPEQATAAVYALAMSHDGALVMSGDVTGELLLWDSALQKPVRKLPNLGECADALSFSSGGRYVAAASSCRHLHLVDLRDDALLVRKTRGNYIKAIAFHPEGTRFYSGDDDGTLCEWTCDAGKPTRSLELASDIDAMAVSPSGAWLAVALGDYSIALVDLQLWKTVRVLHTHVHLVHGLSFSADSRVLLSASRDQTVAVWEIPDGTLAHELRFHRDCVYSAILTPSGAIVSGGLDKRVLRCEPQTGKVENLPCSGAIHAVVGHRGVTVAGGDDGLFWFATP